MIDPLSTEKIEDTSTAEKNMFTSNKNEVQSELNVSTQECTEDDNVLPPPPFATDASNSDNNAASDDSDELPPPPMIDISLS